MTFRYARHTNDLEKIVRFYTEILGLQVLGEFKDHANYGGVFLGLEGSNWHLEFTSSKEPAVHTFDEDDLLVFYPHTHLEYQGMLNRIREFDVQSVEAKNPYWKENGTMILDPDGYGIVVSSLRIKE